jgi:hypothetical protein
MTIGVMESIKRPTARVTVPEGVLPEWDCVAPCKGYPLVGFDRLNHQAGRDSPSKREKPKARQIRKKRAAYPLVHYTLCWAAAGYGISMP